MPYQDYLRQPTQLPMGPDIASVGGAPQLTPMQFQAPVQRQQGGGMDLSQLGTALGGFLDRRGDHNASKNFYDSPMRRKPAFNDIMANASVAA